MNKVKIIKIVGAVVAEGTVRCRDHHADRSMLKCLKICKVMLSRRCNLCDDMSLVNTCTYCFFRNATRIFSCQYQHRMKMVEKSKRIGKRTGKGQTFSCIGAINSSKRVPYVPGMYLGTSEHYPPTAATDILLVR